MTVLVSKKMKLIIEKSPYKSMGDFVREGDVSGGERGEYKWRYTLGYKEEDDEGREVESTVSYLSKDKGAFEEIENRWTLDFSFSNAFLLYVTREENIYPRDLNTD